MSLDPSVLVEVISVRPAMRPSARSSGVVTAAATVAGLAPGSAAETLMVGTSTSGIGATGNRPQAKRPASTSPRPSNEVATGRAMKGAETFTPRHRLRRTTPARAAIARRAANGVRRRGRSPAW